MSLRYPKPLVCAPTAAHTATCIFLHGLGDSGEGWADIGPQFGAALPHVKFLFPTAPERPITLNMGMRMTGWYDIASLEDINQREDKAGLVESQRYVEELIQAEAAAGIPSHRVAVGGFSQGGAVALMMLRSSMKLAGVVGLSTYIPLREQPPVVSEANQGTPVLMCHGDADPVVRYAFGQQSSEQLRALGVPVEFKTFRGMAHSACPPELRDVLSFLQTHLK